MTLDKVECHRDQHTLQNVLMPKVHSKGTKKVLHL